MRCANIFRGGSVAARFVAVTAAIAVCALCHGVAWAEEPDYGNLGGPVKLVIGYQPYGTENLDSIVVREKELWKKYLPAGSSVEMEIALQGSIIVNNMLAGKQQ